MMYSLHIAFRRNPPILLHIGCSDANLQIWFPSVRVNSRYPEGNERLELAILNRLPGRKICRRSQRMRTQLHVNAEYHLARS